SRRWATPARPVRRMPPPAPPRIRPPAGNPRRRLLRNPRSAAAPAARPAGRDVGLSRRRGTPAVRGVPLRPADRRQGSPTAHLRHATRQARLALEGPTAPRPLYGLDRLAARPDAP